jgi:DNA-binding response OmpR family regulator
VKDELWATMKILLVEDHPDVAELSCRVMREIYGHEVRWAETGAQALRAASSEIPELVLIDLNLPDMSGFDVARKLRSDSAFDHTLLVAVTGFGTFVNDDLAKEAGLDAFFRKPLDFDVLEDLERR